MIHSEAEQPDHTEDDILIACALRLDGYKYQDEHNFDHQAAMDHFFQSGEWNISPLEQLTVFFLLQRYLYKWGGEYLTKNSQEWRAFRSLFLATHAHDIPAEYRYPEYYASWEREYLPHLAAYVAQIQSIHDSTKYES